MSVLKSKVLCIKGIGDPLYDIASLIFEKASWQVLKFESPSLRMIVQISAQVNFITFFSNLPDVLVLNFPLGSHNFID